MSLIKPFRILDSTFQNDSGIQGTLLEGAVTVSRDLEISGVFKNPCSQAIKSTILDLSGILRLENLITVQNESRTRLWTETSVLPEFDAHESTSKWIHFTVRTHKSTGAGEKRT